MKFRAERETLADAVATAQRAVASRTGALPVLSGLRRQPGCGVVELVGSDLELTIRVTAPAQGEGEGSVVLPARLFADILRRLDADTVTVELVGDDAHIEAGRFATTLRTLSANDFPRLPEVPTSGVTVGACGTSPTRCAKWCRPRRRTTRGRSSPACCSPRTRAGCALWPPTRTGSRCATSPA